MGKVMKITIMKLQGIPAAGFSEPFVRVIIGRNPPWETPCCVKCSNTTGDFDVQTTITCDDDDTDQPLSVEVVDSSSMAVLASSSVAKWRSYLKENKRSLALDLKPSGSMQVELRIFDKPTHIPDRLDILIASANDLPANIHAPQVVLRVGDVTVNGAMPVTPRRELQGYFEWNEKHTIAYGGESELVIFVRNHDDRLIGKTRYDLMEVLHATKTKHRVVGKLTLTDAEQRPVGSLKLGLALWDSKDVKKNTRSEFDKFTSLRQRKTVDTELCGYMETQPDADIEYLHQARDELHQAEVGLVSAQEVVTAYEDPRNSKQGLKQQKASLKTALSGIEHHLHNAERLLQQVCLQCVQDDMDVGHAARSRINAIARDVKMGSPKNVPSEANEQFVKLEALVKEADRQNELFDDALDGVRHTHHAPDMRSSVKQANSARREMETLLAEAEGVGGSITARMREVKLAQRRADHPMARNLIGPFDQVPEQSVTCFPCC